jgi:hypothetical protein
MLDVGSALPPVSAIASGCHGPRPLRGGSGQHRALARPPVRPNARIRLPLRTFYLWPALFFQLPTSNIQRVNMFFFCQPSTCYCYLCHRLKKSSLSAIAEIVFCSSRVHDDIEVGQGSVSRNPFIRHSRSSFSFISGTISLMLMHF